MKAKVLFFEGGPLQMTIISFFGLLMFFFLIRNIIRMVRNKKLDLRSVNYILLSGTFAILTTILLYLRELYLIMGLIAETGDISMTLFAKGLQLSMIAPIYGMILFMISILAWFILKEIISYKMKLQTGK